MYKYYPRTEFKVNNFDILKLVDISVSAKIKKLVTEYEGVAITPYIIQEGERPDIISNKFYGTPYYEYIILMVNNITNIYDEWPRDSQTFQNYIVEKYGSISFAKENIMHWFDGKRNIISREFWTSLSDDPLKTTETYLDYETRMNYNKSFIRILDLAYIVKFESDIQELLNQ